MAKSGLSLKTKILVLSVIPMLGLLIYVMKSGKKQTEKEARVSFQLPSDINPEDTLQNKEKVYRSLERRTSEEAITGERNKRVQIQSLLTKVKETDVFVPQTKQLSFEEKVDSILRARELEKIANNHTSKRSYPKPTPVKKEPKKVASPPKQQAKEENKAEEPSPVNYGFSSFQTEGKSNTGSSKQTEIDYHKATLYESKDIKKGHNTQVEFILSQDSYISGKLFKARSILNGVAFYNENGCDIIVNSIRNKGDNSPTPVTLFAYNERFQRGVYLISNLDAAVRKTGEDGVYEGARNTSRYNLVSRSIRNFGEAIVGGKDIPLNAGYTMYFALEDKN